MTDVQEQTSGSVEVETLEDRKQRSREMISVSSGRGLSPDTYAEYITLAQGICKPDNILLKEELRGNLPVVIGLLDIAQRARLSVYMLAMKVYVQKGVLCLESQAFHALARPFLQGGLKGEYIGEGPERQLIVRGMLKGDPYEYVHTSPKLKDLHPGHTTKHVNGEAVQFVKGSPLWDRKPDVQLWYDTTRDWIRLHCPEAVLGVYTQEEVDSEDFKDVTPRPTLGERLAVSPRPELREGFRPLEVETTLEDAVRDMHVEKTMAAAPIAPKVNFEADDPPKPKRVRKPPAGKVKAPPKGKKPTARKTRQRPAQAGQEGSEQGPDPEAAYIAQAEAWIAAATDPDKAAQRWDDEYDDRNAAEVSIDERNRLRVLMEERCKLLRSAQ